MKRSDIFYSRRVTVDATYLYDCENRIKDLSERNDMFNTAFKRFFDSLEKSSLPEDLCDSLAEEGKYQQSIFDNQRNLINDLEKEIQVQQRLTPDKKNENKEDDSEDGINNQDKRY